MIVVDTNVIAYLLIPGDFTVWASAALRKDGGWVAPLLWRSEFRNVLTLYIRQGHLTFSLAQQMMQEAESLMLGGEYMVPSSLVFSLVEQSKCSAYDCEFVALAQDMDVPFVTSDARILEAFPSTAVSLETFAG